MTESETFNLTMAQQTYRAHVKRQFHVQKGLGQGTFAKVRIPKFLNPKSNLTFHHAGV